MSFFGVNRSLTNTNDNDNEIVGFPVSALPTLSGDMYQFNSTTQNWDITTGGGGGITTISNIGTGTGFFKLISGSNAEFRSLTGINGIVPGIVGDDVRLSIGTDLQVTNITPKPASTNMNINGFDLLTITGNNNVGDNILIREIDFLKLEVVQLFHGQEAFILETKDDSDDLRISFRRDTGGLAKCAIGIESDTDPSSPHAFSIKLGSNVSSGALPEVLRLDNATGYMRLFNVANNNANTQVLTRDPATNLIEYRDASTLSGNGSFGPASFEATIVLPTVVNTVVDFASFDVPNGGHNLELYATVSDPSISITKAYKLSTQFDYNSGNWGAVQPISSSGYFGNEDFTLEARMIGTVLTLRYRRSAGTVSANVFTRVNYTGSNFASYTPLNVITAGVAVVNALATLPNPNFIRYAASSVGAYPTIAWTWSGRRNIQFRISGAYRASAGATTATLQIQLNGNNLVLLTNYSQNALEQYTFPLQSTVIPNDMLLYGINANSLTFIPVNISAFQNSYAIEIGEYL